MEYKVNGNLITFKKTAEFDIKSILECGQLFRFFKVEDGYKVITGKHIAHITEKEGIIYINCDDAKVFVNYFDLDTDYTAINSKLKEMKELKQAVDFGEGIRIVKGEPEEVILQFIISQNNNIKRIQKIVEKMSDLGDDICDGYKSFPSARKLSEMPVEYFQELGVGYRDQYLKDAADKLASIDLVKIAELDDDKLYDWLLSFKGVGPKVASCIMLFGFHRTNYFPVDTWIEKVYRQCFYIGEMSRPQMSQYLGNCFGAMSGIVQQYLFNFFRNGGLR